MTNLDYFALLAAIYISPMLSKGWRFAFILPPVIGWLFEFGKKFI